METNGERQKQRDGLHEARGGEKGIKVTSEIIFILTEQTYAPGARRIRYSG